MHLISRFDQSMVHLWVLALKTEWQHEAGVSIFLFAGRG
jgi:hypothetical protein